MCERDINISKIHYNLLNNNFLVNNQLNLMTTCSLLWCHRPHTTHSLSLNTLRVLNYYICWKMISEWGRERERGLRSDIHSSNMYTIHINGQVVILINCHLWRWVVWLLMVKWPTVEVYWQICLIVTRLCLSRTQQYVSI